MHNSQHRAEWGCKLSRMGRWDLPRTDGLNLAGKPSIDHGILQVPKFETTQDAFAPSEWVYKTDSCLT
jgi:hypothetical protein